MFLNFFFFVFNKRINSFCFWYVYNVLICICLWFLLFGAAVKAKWEANFNSYSASLYNRITTENIGYGFSCEHFNKYSLFASLHWLWREPDRSKRESMNERTHIKLFICSSVIRRVHRPRMWERKMRQRKNATVLWM